MVTLWDTGRMLQKQTQNRQTDRPAASEREREEEKLITVVPSRLQVVPLFFNLLNLELYSKRGGTNAQALQQNPQTGGYRLGFASCERLRSSRLDVGKRKFEGRSWRRQRERERGFCEQP